MNSRNSYRHFIGAMTLLLMLMTSLAVNAHSSAEHALEKLNEEVRNSPNSAKLLEERGRTYIRLGNYPAALEDFRKMKTVGEPDKGLLGETDIQRLEGNCNKAIENYSTLINKKTVLKNALKGRADCYGQLNEIEKQVKDMETIIEEFSDYELEYHYKLAQILSNSEKHGPQEALKRINQVIKKHGPLVHFQELAIKQNLELQQYEEAKERLMSIEQWMGKTVKWKNQLAEIDTLINNKKGDNYAKAGNN